MGGRRNADAAKLCCENGAPRMRGIPWRPFERRKCFTACAPMHLVLPLPINDDAFHFPTGTEEGRLAAMIDA
jgi:hypothetical protein